MWLVSTIAGFTFGYFSATISESLMHKYFGHASFKVRKFFSKWRIVSDVVHDVHFGHTVVHHAKTFRSDHVTQFDTPTDKEKLDDYLLAEEKEAHIEVAYGLVTSYFGMAYFFIPPFCVLLAMYAVCGRWFTWHFLLAGLIPTLAPPLLSRYLHPYLHLPIADAKTRTGVVTNWILNSWYGKWVKQSHYVHHRHPRYNFNLLFGGDYLLGVYRPASEVELNEMRTIGLLPMEVASNAEA